MPLLPANQPPLMHFPPAALLPYGELAGDAGPGPSPQARASNASFRLFYGAVPPTLSIRDQVAVAVAERILDRRLAPGSRIREQALADEFDVSKAPVSEAMMLLGHAGLVSASAHRGTTVTLLSVGDLDELVEHRGALARSFVPGYVREHRREDEAVLLKLHDQMSTLAPLDAHAFDVAELADRGALYLALRAGNGRIARAASLLSLQWLRYLQIGAATLRQRRALVQAWGELTRLLAAREADRALAHFELTVHQRLEDIRQAVREVA